MTQKTVHILLNPTAGSGIANNNFETIEHYLTAKKIDFDVTTSEFAGNMINLARIKANQVQNNPHELIVVIGGDGTFNQAVNGIKQSHYQETPIAFLPSGTGNDFARAIPLEVDLERALDKILDSPTVTKTDLGFYRDLNHNESHYFINNLGIGFDAQVVSLTNNSVLRKWLNKIYLGKFSYGINVIRTLMSQSTFEVTVRTAIRQKSFFNAYLVTTTNHPYFGGGIPLYPQANAFNKQLATVVVEKPSLPKFIYLFYLMMKNGEHVNSEYFHVFEADKIIVNSKSLQFGQMDGEELGSRAFELEFSVDSFNLLH
ncbi:diacylglycerol kinase family protein [Amylolactobacillus amylotrophicus DSM 20534]|uniref:Diacylglycerol kinase family protein n=3 Tax=Amylolactobacillus TaxID=2767876 RepID=A0A0R1YJP4_9LACO|nr:MULTISPECIES: YegS/Rv2252/BmrU family lipid kinase [Amylolactobacillus]APT19120.1 hypothetical protein LA20533_07615 [Amylolactobacillus amylophilus DSM 20533 = JCM 1125]KRK38613.1 diacylglycerol kinase family protein [Amylolactobacillus amylotrophicus DSM 20534]KRM42744.1 diacylglycerol kinase family protein [Amylolactobacillus amylophilus DSM 20533 = JCM 1125]GED79607.1 transcriptional regulator [Amylolactobacillus amylophilus]